MAHWTEKWLGRPYVEGEHDCMHFLRDVLAHEFGRHLKLPERHATRRRAMARQIADHIDEAAAPMICPPDEGDGILMSVLGSTLGGHHVGLCATPGGEPHVLHCVVDLGSVLWPLQGLDGRGWQVEGAYRWL